MNYPESAKIIIVGGGAIGLSIAYHLGKLGIEDVVLIERNELTSGTSWHAAGIVGPLRASMNLTKLAKYATELFAQLESETGQATGYTQTGGYWLAQTEARITELKRIAAMGDMNNINTCIHSPAQIIERYPLLDAEGLTGGLWVDQDAQVNPVDLCMAYAKGAKANGVRIIEHTKVTDVQLENQNVKSVSLNNDEMINCKVLVNACGVWAREFGKLAGLQLPLAVCEHMYVVTEPIKDLPNPCPILRDLDSEIYIKGDSGKLVIGGFEANAKPWNPTSEGADGAYLMFDEDWDHIAPMIESAMVRIPALGETGIQHFMNGPESFTPDTSQLMGKVAELDNYFIAAGFNSIGIMSSAGVGKVMADWIKQDCPPMDLWEVDVQRYETAATSVEFLNSRMQESVHSQFDMHWPYKQKKTGRNLKLSPLHNLFKQQGAVFGASGIWERPFYFGNNEQETQISYSYGDQSWWPCAKREAETLINHVGLIELSPFTKLKVKGKDAVNLLQHLCTNNVDVAVGRVIYTTMLNERGGIESEHTITRTAEDEFFLISGAVTRVKDLTRLQKQAKGYQVAIEDHTFDLAVLGIMGPKSRELLQSLTDADLSKSAFPFASSKLINLGNIQVRATRISFVGELGWELYIDNTQAVAIFDLLVSHGQQHQLGFVGHFCVDSCRLEKGYLHWGHDVGPDDSPLQAGLDFSVRFNKDFIGKTALLEQQQNGVPGYLIQFSVEAQTLPLLLHDEPVYSGNRIVGRTTSGGLGFRTNKALCHAYIHSDGSTKPDLLNQSYEIEVAGQRFSLIALCQSAYDPENLRLRG